MNIKFSYDPGTSLQQMTLFEMAGKVWSSYLQDDVTVNLQVGVTDSKNLPKKVIGGAIPGMKANVNYQDYRSKTIQDAKSWADHQSLDSLNSAGSYGHFNVTDQSGDQYGFWAQGDTLNMTRANAKALGVISANSSDLDGYILLSDLEGQGVDWSLSGNTATNGKLDLLSTAMHEIGHALGFISGVDQAEALPETVNSSNFFNSQQFQKFVDAVKRATPLDQFRNAATANKYGDPDLSQGSKYGEQFFSLNDGVNRFARFARGDKQKGSQASHWKEQSNTLGVLDPSLKKGERAAISAHDLRALDVIGWDVVNGFDPGYAAANVVLNYQQLYSEAQAGLANRLGRSTSWLDNNQSAAASQLSEVRVADIVAMAQNSQIYDLGWLNNYGGAGAWLNWAQQQGGESFWLNWWNEGGADGWWQGMNQVFSQQGLFETLGEGHDHDHDDDHSHDDGHDHEHSHDAHDQDGQSQVDELTGLPVQQPMPESFSKVATAPSNRLPAHLLDSAVVSPDSLLDYGQSLDISASHEMTYSPTTQLQLGSSGSYGGDALATGLFGLGQDPLQGSAQLASLIAGSARLG